MARRRSFQTRLLFLMVCALVLFAAATLIAVHVAGQRYLGQTLTDELRVGARVLNRILGARGRQLTDAARVLAADFAFREAIASGDRPTITSALTNLGARVGGHAVFLISLDGSVEADTLGGRFVGRPFPVPSLVGRVGSPAEASAIVTLDNLPFQLVVVPVLAPQPIARVCIGFPIDGAVLEDVRRLTELELSLWASNPAGPPILISTLMQEKQLALLEQVRDKTATPETLQLGSNTYQTMLQPIETDDGSSINVLLQRSLEEARRPLRRLELQIFALSSAVLLLAIVAAIFFARGVTSPLRRLAEGAQRIGSGDYSTTVEIARDDEMGQLAVAFNRMGTEISAREIERTRAEEALRTAEEQYRLLFDSNPHPMWVYEQETFAFLAVNDAALRHYGYTRDEFLAMTALDIRPPEEVPAFKSEYAAHRGDHGDAPFYSAHPVKHRKKDGSVIEVDIAASSIVFGGRAARLILSTDVTEKKSLEAQLVRAQKMEAVGQLAGGVAHDFNNLLGVITGNTELLMRDLPPASRERKRGEEIKRATDRAAALTRQLLAFGRRQFLQPKVLDLNAVVAEVEKMLQRLISASIQIVSVAAANLGKVRADAGQIEQVLMNLAINARDAMPSGGRLLIETGNVELDETYTRANPEARPGPHVMLAVSDTGHGMDAKTMSRIFEPFFTTKEEGKGTGLGLATVYGIVRQSGGTVNVHSEIGRGTTFKVYLPRVEAEVETEARADSTVPPDGTETILLVEDAEALRLLVRELLESAGYTVMDAEAPDKALSLIQSTPGPIHLVLTDMVMPGMSGLELAKRVATLKPEARVVFMSGYSDQAMGDQGTLEPGTLFLQKPFTMDALMRTIRGALDAAS